MTFPRKWLFRHTEVKSRQIAPLTGQKSEKCFVFYVTPETQGEISFRSLTGLQNYCKYSPVNLIFNLVIFFHFIVKMHPELELEQQVDMEEAMSVARRRGIKEVTATIAQLKPFQKGNRSSLS